MQPTSSHPEADDSTIIRAGSDGRLRYSPAQKQSLLEAFDRSGTSAMAFARQHGVQYQTFIAWLRKRRENMRKGQHEKRSVPLSLRIVIR